MTFAICQRQDWLLTSIHAAWNWNKRNSCALLNIEHQIRGSLVVGIPSYKSVIKFLVVVGRDVWSSLINNRYQKPFIVFPRSYFSPKKSPIRLKVTFPTSNNSISAPRTLHSRYRMKESVLQRGVKNDDREPSWCRSNLVPFSFPIKRASK